MSPAGTVTTSSGVTRSMESRTGRSNQRYNTKGERLVAGVVPLTEDKSYVMLIQSTRRKGWVLPKGGWETDEECHEAAAREAWEEAGILVEIVYDLGEIRETSPRKKSSQTNSSGSPTKDGKKEKERSLYHFYEVTVTSEEADWPEREKRERKWFTFVEAHELLKDRPELQTALERSRMRRSL
ncbi:diadenosine and diphosphoinositol polyphosphate phosphohydrolase-like protein [Thermochaetoides thermophila DSM 1495]|uniref:Diadenosine and diphosphoinositol polyphosphate phosphohydrolase-like protein n=1 Tax=Chaetomium thermophilum (strain DSM 1495 / CBS 144.50 / IMI 039719) TaxID=759272 RepID=G0RY78_CHATD|nr:diadenosine and diphosphoinositol polyphosphate phosphohydrolase-like protein [Thermochaetoides thermophila DSM 1495]EGS23864.1 diadenosine and diphosphoinositol polyphosphate phosphohydrolase-like protein [Thermochaetoides thermophila DSM 1495]